VLPVSPVLPGSDESPGAEPLPVPLEPGGVVVVSPLPGPVVLPLPFEPPELPLPGPGVVSLAGGVVSAGLLAGG
jgi:hypothetical protein